MRKILALLVFVLTSTAFLRAQVIGVNPTPIAVYYWNTTTNAWTQCSNSSTAEPFASTPQAIAYHGFNSGLGQWTPEVACPGSGGGSPIGTYTKIGAYLVSPSGGSATLGPAQLSTDTATNTNFYVPGLISVLGSGGSIFLGQDWTNNFLNFGGTFRNAGGANGVQYQSTIFNSATPGTNNLGSGVFVNTLYSIQANSWSAGNFNASGMGSLTLGVGDHNYFNINVNGKNGWTTGSQEGDVGYRFYWDSSGSPGQTSGTPMLIATVGSTGTDSYGQTTVSLPCTVDCWSLGVGHPLIDKTTALSVTATGVSTISSGANQMGLVTFSGTPFTPDVTCRLVSAVTVPDGTQINQPVSESISLNSCSAALTVGQVFAIAGGEFETSKVATITTAFTGSAGSITGVITAPISHSYAVGGWVGGASGTSSFAGGSYEQTVYNAGSGGIPNELQFVAAVTSNTAWVSVQSAGVLQTGYILPSGAVNIYHSAIVVDAGNSCTFANIGTGRSGDTCAYAGSSTGTVTATIGINNGFLNSGDTVWNPSVAANLVISDKRIVNESDPYGIIESYDSLMPFGTVYGSKFFNLNGLNLAAQTTKSQGGYVVAPVLGLLQGGFSAGFAFQNYPDGGFYSPTAGGTYGACLWCFGAGAAFPAGSSQTYVDIVGDYNTGFHERYSPATKTIDFSSASTFIPPSSFALPQISQTGGALGNSTLAATGAGPLGFYGTTTGANYIAQLCLEASTSTNPMCFQDEFRSSFLANSANTLGEAQIYNYASSSLLAAFGNSVSSFLTPTSNYLITGGQETSIASATTIAPTTPYVTISGTAAIQTVTPNAVLLGSTNTAQSFKAKATGAWSTVSGGNIATTMTAVIGKAYYFDYWTDIGAYVITTTGGSGMVYPGAGIAVSTGSAWGTSLTAPSSALVGISDTQTLTNKSIAAGEINSGQLATSQGGTGINTSSATGYPSISSGSWSVSSGINPAAVANENVLSFSATPTFSTSASLNTIALSGNITSFTLPAGTGGQQMCLAFVHDATSTAYTITAPSNVKGLFGPGSSANLRSQQCFTYSASQSIWMPQSSGSINF